MSSASNHEMLRSLLREARPGAGIVEKATDRAIAHARALGPDEAGDAVAAILEGYAPGHDSGVASRAADLAYALRLERAVPSLVGCVERLSQVDPVAHAALRALERLREHATEPLLAAFGRCVTREARVRIGTALVRAGTRDGRVRAALVTMLADDPIDAAGLLGAHGDRDAVRGLLAALDRLVLATPGPGELVRCEEIVAVGQAILALGGTLLPEQRARFERAYRRSDELWALGGPELDEFIRR